MKKISIAMATYCGERFLPQQLDSIAGQTRRPLELIVCDDCSTDTTKSILERFAATAPFPVKIYNNGRNLGYIDNFFEAISLCRGDYIALSDQDDVWFSNKLEVAADALEQGNVWLHSHSASLIDTQGRHIGEHRPIIGSRNVSYREFDPWNTFFGFTCTFKRELLSIVPLEDRPVDLIFDNKLMAHDRWITNLGLLMGPVAYTDTPIVAYRQHSQNVFGARSKYFLNKIRKIRYNYINYLGKRAAISNKMLRIAEDLVARDMGDRQDAVHFWSELADRYARRHEVFTQRYGIAQRASGVLKTYKLHRDLREFTEDFIAAIVTA